MFIRIGTDVAIVYIRVLFEEPDIMKKYSGVA